ncbi:MAG: hypothetical protein ACOC44_18695 [Promethearchaeia archaeon]
MRLSEVGKPLNAINIPITKVMVGTSQLKLFLMFVKIKSAEPKKDKVKAIPKNF